LMRIMEPQRIPDRAAYEIASGRSVHINRSAMQPKAARSPAV